MPGGYDYQTHVVSVRLRLSGSGEFLSTLSGLEDSPSQDLVDTTMASNPPRPVSLLSNIQSTRIRFHGRVENIDEHFRIKSLTFFVKQVATGYPQ